MKPKLPPEPDLLGDALEENRRLREQIEKLRGIADELCQCIENMRSVTADRTHVARRIKRALAAYEDFKS